MTHTPAEIVAKALRQGDTDHAGITAEIVLSYLARAGFVVLPRADVVRAANYLSDLEGAGVDHAIRLRAHLKSEPQT